MQIVNLFYEIARQHRQLRGFFYGKSYEKGAANEAHPLLWVDDPIHGQSVGNAIRYTVNVDVLGIPKGEEDVVCVQDAAYGVGLAIAERLKQTRGQTGYSLDSFSLMSLRDYYDNNAAGFRFTYVLIQANPVARCADHFDPCGQLAQGEALPYFPADSCVVFDNKMGLPNFEL